MPADALDLDALGRREANAHEWDCDLVLEGKACCRDCDCREKYVPLTVAERDALVARAREAAQMSDLYLNAEAFLMEQLIGHWFIQGGKAQFGAHIAGTNPDEVIASILRVVRAKHPTVAALAAPAPVRTCGECAKWATIHNHGVGECAEGVSGPNFAWPRTPRAFSCSLWQPTPQEEA
jgi:hypothetical protein